MRGPVSISRNATVPRLVVAIVLLLVGAAAPGQGGNLLKSQL